MDIHPTAEGHEWPIAVIPVIDLLNGQVVRARAGERSSYAPIQTPLVQGSDPFEVLRALLNRTKAKTAYVADLNGIMDGQAQWPLLNRLSEHFASTEIWIDAGFISYASAYEAILQSAETQSRTDPSEEGEQNSFPKNQKPRSIPGRSILTPVLGTETLLSLEDLSHFAQECVLSLDFGQEGFRGDPDWLSHPEYWADRVIVMTLAKVGVGAGPDIEEIERALLKASRLESPPHVFAAGGVALHHALPLKQLGIAGALVASALHV
jgi:phosphoribosylformimino-5-aminoimidazole carboxamide ribotide isomerase